GGVASASGPPHRSCPHRRCAVEGRAACLHPAPAQWHKKRRRIHGPAPPPSASALRRQGAHRSTSFASKEIVMAENTVIPSSVQHNIDILFGSLDADLVAWQQATVQAAKGLIEAAPAKLKPAERQRLTKALALVQGGLVDVHEDGSATVQSGTKKEVTYRVEQGRCTCPDAVKRPSQHCKHTLAVTMHQRAAASLADAEGLQTTAPEPEVPVEIEPDPHAPALASCEAREAQRTAQADPPPTRSTLEEARALLGPAHGQP